MMQVAEITGASMPLKVTTRPLPETPSTGYLIRTLFSGICHTDLHYIKDEIQLGGGKLWRHRDVLGEKFVGSIPGHEICGVVEGVGEAVPPEAGVKAGDTVAVYPWRGCRECEFCLAEKPNLCEQNKGTTTDIGKGYLVGGYSSHIALVDWELAVKLPDSIPREVGCMLPCSGLTTYSAVTRALPYLRSAREMRGSARLLVIGAGGLGLWCCLLVKKILKESNVRVTFADISQEKLDEARDSGADDGILWGPEESVENLVAKTTEDGKIDAIIDVVGSPKTASVAVGTLHNGGTLILLGLGGGEVSMSLPGLISRSIVVQGNRTGTIGALRELVDQMAAEGEGVQPGMEMYSLQQVNTALDNLRRGQVKGRAIITFNQ